MGDINIIEGSEEVIGWFGYIPNFHDAEIEELTLRHSPEISSIKVRCWRRLGHLDGKGNYGRDRCVVISFQIHDILSMRLYEWNHQNVISNIEIDKGEDGYKM